MEQVIPITDTLEKRFVERHRDRDREVCMSPLYISKEKNTTKILFMWGKISVIYVDI